MSDHWGDASKAVSPGRLSREEEEDEPDLRDEIGRGLGSARLLALLGVACSDRYDAPGVLGVTASPEEQVLSEAVGVVPAEWTSESPEIAFAPPSPRLGLPRDVVEAYGRIAASHRTTEAWMRIEWGGKEGSHAVRSESPLPPKARLLILEWFEEEGPGRYRMGFEKTSPESMAYRMENGSFRLSFRSMSFERTGDGWERSDGGGGVGCGRLTPVPLPVVIVN